MKKRILLLLNLFFTMLKIGLFTFGGGYAMISILENEYVDKKKWMEKEEFMDMVAIAESTPGPIAINSATYIGYKMAKTLGSIVCTIAICLPSVCIIYAISHLLDAFLSNKVIAAAFKGIQVGVVYLIGSAGFRMLKKIKKTPLNIIVTLTVICCLLVFELLSVNFSEIFYVLLSGFIGLIAYHISKRKKPNNEEDKGE